MKSRVLFQTGLSLCALIWLSCNKDNSAGPDTSDTPASTGTFAQVGTFQAPAEAIASLALSPDGKTLAFGTFADNSVRLVDVTTRQLTRAMSGHSNRVTAMAFSPDSRTLASTGTVNLTPGDGSVRLWDVGTGSQLASVSTTGTSQLAFSPNGSLLAGASGGDPLSVRLWNTSGLALQRTITGVFRIVAFCPDGSRILAAARDEKVYVMDCTTGSQVTMLTGHAGWVTAAAYSRDGGMLASCADDRVIQIWSVQTSSVTKTLTGHTTYPEFVLFSPDGSTLATMGSGTNIVRTSSATYFTLSDADRFLRLWDVSAGAELPRLDTGTDIVSDVAFSADWKVMATGSTTGLIRIFKK